MTTSTTNEHKNYGVSVAQLAIYALFAPPIIYLLIRHGKRGFLGWLYLFIFCVLRVTGSAMFLHDPRSSGAVVIPSIGLSPLLLATLGILHEARSYRIFNLARHIEVPLMVALHLVIASAIGLIAAGTSSLTNADPKTSSFELIKVGVVILFVCWVVILLVTLVTLFYDDGGWNRKNARSGALSSWEYRDGTKLLYAIFVSLLPTGIRVLYSVVSVFTQSALSNPVTGSLALRLCLQVLPEMIAVVIFMAVGLWTRDIGS